MFTDLKSLSLPLTSLFLALAIALTWGFNFIMVRSALDEIPPITLCALRFFLAAFPAVFFIPRPKAPWRYIVGYGLITFALQFTLLFAGIYAGVAPGTAALISQLQVFFAIFLAWAILRQPVSFVQMVGAMIALAGIALLFSHQDSQIPFMGFVLIVLASFCWGLGNLVSVKLKTVNMFSLIVWSSLVACVPLFALAFALETPLPLFLHLHELKGSSLLAVAYITYASTYFGYSCWSWLLSKHAFASISPFALLCPIVAMISSALFLDEPMESWKSLSAAIVIAGLAINTFGARIYQRARSLVFRKSLLIR